MYIGLLIGFLFLVSLIVAACLYTGTSCCRCRSFIMKSVLVKDSTHLTSYLLFFFFLPVHVKRKKKVNVFSFYFVLLKCMWFLKKLKVLYKANAYLHFKYHWSLCAINCTTSYWLQHWWKRKLLAIMCKHIFTVFLSLLFRRVLTLLEKMGIWPSTTGISIPQWMTLKMSNHFL